MQSAEQNRACPCVIATAGRTPKPRQLQRRRSAGPDDRKQRRRQDPVFSYTYPPHARAQQKPRPCRRQAPTENRSRHPRSCHAMIAHPAFTRNSAPSSRTLHMQPNTAVTLNPYARSVRATENGISHAEKSTITVSSLAIAICNARRSHARPRCNRSTRRQSASPTLVAPASRPLVARVPPDRGMPKRSRIARPHRRQVRQLTVRQLCACAGTRQRLHAISAAPGAPSACNASRTRIPHRALKLPTMFTRGRAHRCSSRSYNAYDVLPVERLTSRDDYVL